DSAAPKAGSRSADLDVAFPLSGQGRHAEVVISELNGWPTGAPGNASPMTLRPSAYDSGSRRFARPFLYGSCIRYSMPVYPGASPDPFGFLFARPHLPQFDCFVFAARRQRLPVWAVYQGHDHIRVSSKSSNISLLGHVPKLDRPVLTPAS